LHRKIVAILILASIILSPLCAEAELSYKPYGEDEFPVWTMKLRRAETLFFGSTVLTFPIAAIIVNICQSQGYMQTDSDLGTFGYEAAIASSLSAGIAFADWVIGEIKGE